MASPTAGGKFTLASLLNSTLQPAAIAASPANVVPAIDRRRRIPATKAHAVQMMNECGDGGAGFPQKMTILASIFGSKRLILSMFSRKYNKAMPLTTETAAKMASTTCGRRCFIYVDLLAVAKTIESNA